MIDYTETYDRLYEKGYHADKTYSHAKKLCDYIEQNFAFDSILDIGCSHGWVLRRFAQKLATGIDVSPHAVAMCCEDGLEAAVVSAHELPFNDGEFDCVISTDCFEHLHPDHVDQAIYHAVRCAKSIVAMKICPRVDQAPWKHEVGHDLHLTVQPVSWWQEKFLNEIARQGKRKLCHDGHDGAFIIKFE